jgi:hypothetical protein
MDSELMKYFVAQTNARLLSIETKLDDLAKFKAEMLFSAKMVGAVFGSIASLVVGIVVHYVAK